MVDIVQKLPEHIKLHILSYTYSPQPKYLLLDIKTYVSSHITLHNYYYSVYKLRWNIEENYDTLNWLIHDLIFYSNQDIPIQYGYVDYFYNIMRRNFMLQPKTKEGIDKIISKLHNKKSTSKINIIWGLYKPYERIRFIINMYHSNI
jgi:hypothetical protein